MKVAFAELLAAALRVQALAQMLQGSAPSAPPALAQDPTSIGAAARLELAAGELWASSCAQAQSLHIAGAQMFLIAVKFGTQEEVNAANLAALQVALGGIDAGTLAALPPVPPLAPDVRAPLAAPAGLTGEVFSQLVTNGSSGAAATFTTAATTNGTAADNVALALREIAATVPDLWESPEGTAALASRLTHHGSAADGIAERWQGLGDQSQKLAEAYSQAVTVVPKPLEFEQNAQALQQAHATNVNNRNAAVISQLIRQRGELEQRALATAARYHVETEAATAPDGAAAQQPSPAGVDAATAGPGGGHAAGAPAGVGANPGEAPLQKAAAGAEAASPGQAGEAAGQLASILPAALGAIGGLAGGAAGMVGQLPQTLMQTGQGLAQAATQGMSGMTSQKPPGSEKLKSGAGLDSLGDPAGAGGGSGGGGGGGGDTRPAGALGPPVTPSTTSHTPPTIPAGAAGAPPATSTARGSAMGAVPMGMPIGGMVPPGGGQGDARDQVPADKKLVVPPTANTESVTGKVSDRTAAAAEASRARAEADDSDDDPPRGPIMRRITLAPLQDDGS
jgi:hypothetical protein